MGREELIVINEIYPLPAHLDGPIKQHGAALGEEKRGLIGRRVKSRARP
jgi:hypothetical protein